MLPDLFFQVYLKRFLGLQNIQAYKGYLINYRYLIPEVIVLLHLNHVGIRSLFDKRDSEQMDLV